MLTEEEERQISGSYSITEEIMGFYKKLLGSNVDA